MLKDTSVSTSCLLSYVADTFAKDIIVLSSIAWIIIVKKFTVGKAFITVYSLWNKKYFATEIKI